MFCLWFICYTDLERLEVADTAALPAPDAGRRDDGGAAELGRHDHQEQRGHQLQHRVTRRHGTSRGRTILTTTSSLFPARVRAADWCGAGQGREISGETRGRGGSSAWRWSAAVSSLYTSAALECSVFGQCLGRRGY